MVAYPDFHAVVATVSPVLFLVAFILIRHDPRRNTTIEVVSDVLLAFASFLAGAICILLSLLILGDIFESTETWRELLIFLVGLQIMTALLGTVMSHGPPPSATLPPDSPNPPTDRSLGDSPSVPPSMAVSSRTVTTGVRLVAPMALAVGWGLAHWAVRRRTHSPEP